MAMDVLWATVVGLGLLGGGSVAGSGDRGVSETHALAVGAPFFEVNCKFSEVCSAQLELCGSQTDAGCRDHGVVQCNDGSSASLEFDGSFVRSQDGNKIVLTGDQAAATELAFESLPQIIMGPAKSPPRPGQPVVADSTLTFASYASPGECAVRLRR